MIVQVKAQVNDFLPLKIEIIADGIPSQSCQIILENKIRALALNYGLSASSNVMTDYSLVVVYNNYTAEQFTGFKSSYLITGELFLYFQNSDHKLEFATVSIKLDGSASSKDAAFKKGVNSINLRSPKYATFFKDGKKHMLEFENKQCVALISKAKRFNATSEYLKALEVLNHITIESKNCEPELLELLEGTYIKLIDGKCEALLLKGQSSIAVGDHLKAFEYFSLIDPESACFQELVYFIDEVKNEIKDDKIRREFKELMRRKDNLEMEKIRINAMIEIAKAINQPINNDIYTYIIK